MSKNTSDVAFNKRGVTHLNMHDEDPSIAKELETHVAGVFNPRHSSGTFHLVKGALHKELGVAPGSKIPAKKLTKALHSSNPLERKRAQFAKNAKKFHHA